MPRKLPPVTSPYVDLHGRPLDPWNPDSSRRGAPSPAAASGPKQPTEPREVVLTPEDVEAVFAAMCLAGLPRGKTWLTQFMRHLERRHSSGRHFSATEVSEASRQLVAQGRATQSEYAGVGATAPLAQTWWQAHLEPELAALAYPAWARASASYMPPGNVVPMPTLREPAEHTAFARLLLYAGLNASDFASQRAAFFRNGHEAAAIAEAALNPFMPGRFERLEASLRNALLQEWVNRFVLEVPLWTPLLAWLDEQAQQPQHNLPVSVRLAVAEWRCERADAEGALQLLARMEGPRTEASKAAVLAVQGQWATAAEGLAAANKALCALANARRGLLSPHHLRLHLLALLAQPSPQAWTAARKLAVAESGSRRPAATGWGLWAHAAAARLGDEPVDPVAFSHQTGWGVAPHRENADRLVLAAWLGHEPARWGDAEIEAVVRHFESLGRTVWADLLRQAAARFGWAVPGHTRPTPPWPVAFFGGPRETWRDALAAIAALGEQKASAPAAHAVDPTLLWQLLLDDEGRVIEIEPFERPANPRSRALPKAVPLSRIKKSVRLDPRDAAVARCIEKAAYEGSGLGLDVVAAAVALVNHPGVTLEENPSQPVELREALPEMEVRRVRQDDGHEAFEFHLLDPLSHSRDIDLGTRWAGSSWNDEIERRNTLRVLPDGEDRARLIRITPAQRRVAELVGQRWAVPVDAKAELDAALRVLAGHFQLHSDAAAGQGVASDARLVAQLLPRGEALQLRLVARPFGSFGPVVQPGHGRARLLTVHEGLQLSTERALDAEQAHLAQVLEALPFLADADEGDATWLLDDPEQALHALEVLPGLAAVASLDWPRGKPVRVTPVASQGVKVALSSGRDWFTVDGEVQVDDTRVISLQRLMDLLRESRQGRFIALGEGEYLALTERLRAQLADLQAMASSADKSGLRLPAAAAAFLEQALEGTTLQADKTWAKRLARLEEAASLQPAPPAGLMAELRGYQVEGFAWMARLAHAGLGAILADDMGLGKTVQTLALLLTRAPLGPALVIAPTSVCGNWVAEAARFAPSLRVLSFGEGDRAEMLQSCGPGDLVVASYGLTQIEGQAVAEREWATLVLDEAQALKNAATKRAKAIGMLKADFRLALSGTPVENRLADLWSLMNLLNPGLLGSSGQFTERFAGPIERQRDEAVRSRLRRLVSPFLLRRTKAQVLADLPPRTEIVHRVEPGPEERAFLEAARRSAVERVAQIDSEDAQAAFHVLAELTRLRRAACDPRLAAPELGLVGAKAQEFEQLALELVAGRHKALVFSQFTDFLDLLAQRLQAAGVAYQMLTGSTPAAERTQRVAAFQAGEGDLFLISLKAGGFGLNLTAADYVIIVDPWWNPAAEDQASGRAHRIGQQRPVTVYRLVTAGSIEERIIELHRHKRDLADGILEGQDQGRPMGAAELRELLGEA